MTSFNPEYIQSGDGNVSEPIHVGRPGQQVIFSNISPSESYTAKYPTIESVPEGFNGTVDIVTSTYRATVKGDGINLTIIGYSPLEADRPSATLFISGTWLVGKDSYSAYNGKWTKNTISAPGGKFVNNLLQKQWVSEYTQSLIAGTGTPTIVKDDTTEKVTITIPATLSGRAFLSMDAMSFLAGHTYCISFELGTLVKHPAAGGNFLDVVAAPTVDFGEFRIAMSAVTANTKFAAIFQPTTTQNVTFRLGFGIAGNQTASTTDSVVEISKILIEDLSVSGSVIPNEYVGARQSAIISTNYIGSLTTATSGALTLTSTTKSDLEELNVAIFGDSYVNDSTDYPEQLKTLSYPKIGVWYQPWISSGVASAGKRPSEFLVPFTTKMQKLIDSNLTPKYVLLQSSLNTAVTSTLITQDARIAEDLAAIRTAAEWAIARGITPILTNMAAWKTGAGAAWITDSVYLCQQKWDMYIYALAAELNVPIFNLRGTVEDTTTPYVIAAAYDSGDGIHPNAAGFLVIATKLQTFIAGL